MQRWKISFYLVCWCVEHLFVSLKLLCILGYMNISLACSIGVLVSFSLSVFQSFCLSILRFRSVFRYLSRSYAYTLLCFSNKNRYSVKMMMNNDGERCTFANDERQSDRQRPQPSKSTIKHWTERKNNRFR